MIFECIKDASMPFCSISICICVSYQFLSVVKHSLPDSYHIVKQYVMFSWTHNALQSRYDGVVIPGSVDQHICGWGVMRHTTDLTHDGRSSFEVESNTVFCFVGASDATFTDRSDTVNPSKIGFWRVSYVFKNRRDIAPSETWGYLNQLGHDIQ